MQEFPVAPIRGCWDRRCWSPCHGGGRCGEIIYYSPLRAPQSSCHYEIFTRDSLTGFIPDRVCWIRWMADRQRSVVGGGGGCYTTYSKSFLIHHTLWCVAYYSNCVRQQRRSFSLRLGVPESPGDTIHVTRMLVHSPGVEMEDRMWFTASSSLFLIITRVLF